MERNQRTMEEEREAILQFIRQHAPVAPTALQIMDGTKLPATTVITTLIELTHEGLSLLEAPGSYRLPLTVYEQGCILGETVAHTMQLKEGQSWLTLATAIVEALHLTFDQRNQF